MAKFKTGEKYNIYRNEYGSRKNVWEITILNRTAKFITYSDNFFGKTQRKKIEVDESGNERLFGFYNGVLASDLKTYKNQ